MSKIDDELDELRNELKECQESKDFNTCSKCEEFFSCVLRLQFVKTTYQSMNPDNGGFEF